MAKVKNIDITKVGPQRYTQLQDANNAAYIENDPDLSEYMQNLRPIGHGMNPYQNATQRVSLPNIGGTPWGESKYDNPNTTISGLEHLQDIRANNQPWYDTLGNGLAKFAGKVGTTILGTFAGIPTGIATAIGEGRSSGLWDNDVTNALSDLDETMERNFTVYQTEKQQNAKWWEPAHLTSAKFWADDIITNAGFTVGAALSGNITGGALGLATRLAKMAQLGARGQKASALVSSLVSATAEGSIEAQQGEKEYVNNGLEILKTEYNKKLESISNLYNQNKGSFIKTAEGKMIDPVYIEYQNNINKLNQQYNQAVDNLQEEGRKVGNRILLGNQVLLTINNLVQFGKSFSKSFRNASRYETGNNKALGSKYIKNSGISFSEASERMGKRIAANEGKVTSEMVNNTGIKLDIKKPFGGKLLAGSKSILVEGSEEMNQQFITSSSESYYENRHKTIDGYWKDRLGVSPENKETESYINQFGEALADGLGKSWGDINQWEQFLIGGLMGGIGSPAPTKLFNQDKTKSKFNPARYFSWEGGVINALIDYNKKISAAQGNLKNLNELLTTEKFWNNWYKNKKDLATTLAIQSRQDKHLNEGNKKLYKDDEDDYFAHVINTFARAGKVDDLKAIYNSHVDLSDEEIEDIVKKSTKVEDNSEDLKRQIEEAQARKQSLIESKKNLIEQQKNDLSTKGTSEIDNESIENFDKHIKEEDELISKLRGTKPTKTYISPYTDTNGNRTVSNEEIRKSLNDVSEGVNQKINDYLEALERVQNDTRGRLDNEKEDVLTYLAFKNKSSLERAGKIFEKSKIIPKNFVVSGLTLGDKRVTSREEIRDALQLDDSFVVDNNNGTFTINTNGLSSERRQSIFIAINSDKENNKLLNREIDRIALEKRLNSAEKTEAIKDLNDYFSLVEDASEYNTKLIDYIFNPSKITIDKDNIKNAEETKAAKDALTKELSGKSLSDILTSMNNGDIPDNLNVDELDEDIKNTYEVASKIFKKYTSITEAINDSNIDDAAKDLLLFMLDSKLPNVTNPEDLYGITPKEIKAANSDDILGITGYNSREEFLKAMDYASSHDASESSLDEDFNEAVEDLKNGALEAYKEIVDKEKAKDKKLKESPKKRTTEEKKQEEKEEKNEKEVGRDSVTKLNTTNGTIIVPLATRTILGKNTEMRAIKTFVPGSNSYSIKFQYKKGDKWSDAYVEIPASYFNDFKNTYDSKGNPLDLETITKDGNIKVLSIESKIINGKIRRYATIYNGKSTKARVARYKSKSTGRTFYKSLNVFIKSDSSIDTMLGVEEGSLDSASVKGSPIKVTRVKGNKVDEGEIIKEAIEDSKIFSKEETSITTVKPNTTRFYIHPFTKNGIIFKPWHEIEENEALAKIHKTIHDFLNEENAFKKQETVKNGDAIYFAFSKELNKRLAALGAEPVLLILNDKGDIIGDLMSPNDKAFSNRENIVELYNYARKQLDASNGEVDVIIKNSNGENLVSHVSNKYIGVPHLGDEYKPATETLVTSNSEGVNKPDFELGVVQMETNKMSTSLGDKVTVKIPNSAVQGKPYVLIHTSDPTRPWYPVPILMDTLDYESHKDSDFYKVLINQLNKIKNAVNNNTLTEYKDEIRNFLALKENEIFINKNKEGGVNIEIRGKVISTISAEELNSNNNLGEKIIQDLSNYSNSSDNLPISISISKNLFNREFTLYDNDLNIIKRTYKEIIGDLIYTNLVSNKTVNDFFDINPIIIDKDGKTSEGKGERLKSPKGIRVKESRTPTSDNPKSLAPKSSYYYYNEGDTIVICDKDGNKVSIDSDTSEKETLNIAYAYILAQGFTEDGKYPIPFINNNTLIVSNNGNNLAWGDIPVSQDTTTNSFVDKFKEDQKKVDRSKTTSEQYEIDNEPYVRVHHKIDSLYGPQVTLEKSQLDTINNIQKALDGYNSFQEIDEAINSLPFIDSEARDELSKILNNQSLDEETRISQIKSRILSIARDVATGMRGSRALRIGSAVDSIVRDFFTNPNSPSTYEKYKNIMSEKAYNNIRQSLAMLYNEYKDKFTFIADTLVVGTTVDGENIAGEIDMLVVDKKTGNIEIWDIKTSSRPFIKNGKLNPDFYTVSPNSKFTRSQQEQYTIQLNAYREMIESKYPSIKGRITSLRILPFYVKYNTTSEGKSGNNAEDVIRQDLITLQIKDNVLSKKAASDTKDTKKSSDIAEVPKSSIKTNTSVIKLNKAFIKSKISLSSKKLDSVWEEIDKMSEEEKNALAKYLSTKTTIRNLTSKKVEDIISTLKRDSSKFLDKKEDIGKELPPGIEMKKSLDNSKFRNKQSEIESKEERTNKEIAKIRRALPQLSRDNAITLVDSLIKTPNGYAWGMFRNGLITIYRNSARGTVYHEAFHYVFNTLLNDTEISRAYNEARSQWGNLSREELEEKMAEDFREYMQDEESFIGRLKHIWRNLKNFINKIIGKGHYLDSLYADIASGKLSTRNSTTSENISRYKKEEYTQEMKIILNNAPRVRYRMLEVADINNLRRNPELINYLREKGVSLKEYRNMSEKEREVLTHCMM